MSPFSGTTTGGLRPFVTVIAFAVLVAGPAFAADAVAGGSGGIGSAPESSTAEPSASGDESRTTNRRLAKYDRLWDRASLADKRWARRTAECESGGDPDAIGGGGAYRGAFQFLRSTWKRAPKSPGGDPIAYPYRTQAVVAVLLKNRDGAGHWPVCG